MVRPPWMPNHSAPGPAPTMPPSSSRPSPSRRRAGSRSGATPGRTDRPAPRRTPPILLVGAVAILGFGVAVGTWISWQTWNRDRPARLLAEARAATEAGDRTRGLAAWHAWNETSDRSAATLVIEAQLAEDLNRGRDADRLARQATRLDAGSAPAWTLQINRLRVLDQAAEAMQRGLLALGDLRTTADRRAILKVTTLATLAEVPDAEARAQLDRWIATDPDDIDARAARMSRIAANPHAGDPDRPQRIAELEQLVARHPANINAREALTVALADAGEVVRGRVVLGEWPVEPTNQASAPREGRGYRFDRLQARWDLEYDHNPAQAAAGFRAALTRTPHDWKLHYGLARACRILQQTDEAKGEALAVARLRERLDPVPLGARLTTDFARIDEGSAAEGAAAMLDLAALCRSVGLVALADAWTRAAAANPATDSPTSLSPPP